MKSAGLVAADTSSLHGTAPEIMDAECALLGALLCEPSLVADVARTLQPLDFYGAEFNQSPNAAIFAVLLADSERGAVTEPYTLAVQLSADLAELGGGAYIGDLLANGPPASSVPELVRQLATAASQRRIVRALARPSVAPEELAAILQAEARKADELSTRARPIRATPFQWVEPQAIPARAWLYDRHYIRKFVSATFSPGGVGKTMQAIVEAVAMASGRNLLGAPVREPLRVWLVNLEDPREEIERRVAAVCLNFGIKPEDLGDRLFIDSGREAEFVVAQSTRQGVELCAPVLRQIEREVVNRRIDVVILDPFVACHLVSENDNGAINLVVKAWRSLADQTNIAIDLVSHTRKANFGQAETTVEDGRGASALLAGVRSARVLNVMSEQQAAEWGIEERRLYFRVDNGKANLSPPSSRAKWRRLVDVDLENGPTGFSDRVGVPCPWEPPAALEGLSVADLRAVQNKVAAGNYRASEQAADWVGRAVAEVLDWNLDDPRDKPRTKAAIKSWMASGALKTELRMDSKKREMKPFVAVGAWAE